jgi:hypothetical protein
MLVVLAKGELFARDSIRSTRDLKGKTAVTEVIDNKLFISMFAAYVGLNPEKDINWAVYPASDWLSLFSKGKIDAFMAGPPLSEPVGENLSALDNRFDITWRIRPLSPPR